MGSYEYFVVLLVVLVGLALSDLTISTHKLLAAGRKVHWHWAAPAVAVLSAILVVGEFMSAWSAKNKTVHFPNMLASIGLFVLLYLGAAAALPDEVPSEGLDLKSFYSQNRAHFWGAMAIFMVAQTALVAVNPLNQMSPDFLYFVGQDLLAALVCASLIWTNRSWWHGLCIAALFILELANWWNIKLG